MAQWERGERVCLRQNPAATGTVVGVTGPAPRISWDPASVIGDTGFGLAGLTVTMPEAFVAHVRDQP